MLLGVWTCSGIRKPPDIQTVLHTEMHQFNLHQRRATQRSITDNMVIFTFCIESAM